MGARRGKPVGVGTGMTGISLGSAKHGAQRSGFVDHKQRQG